MSEFWKRKIRKYFSTIDFDSDGVVSKNDFVGMAESQGRLGNPEKQKTAEHLKTQYEVVWELFAQNAGNGSRNTLTVDEFIISIGKQRYDPKLMKPYTELINGLHDMLDTSRDGFLQEDEYELIFFRAGIPDISFAREAFKAIDANGDGKLSAEEFANAFFDFFFSDDEKSPHATFLGPLDN